MMVQHGVNPISKTRSKTEKKKQKKKKNEETHESDDGGEELDLSKELFPLSHYVGDPVDLINQIFSTITGPKIALMLPPILKGADLDDLKNECIHELLGMSKKRILCVINGQEMEGSSGSDEDEEDDDMVLSPVKGTSPRGSIKRPIPSKEAAAAALLKKIKQEPVSDDEVQERDPVTGKSVMELLELEMRARIIKTMLDKGGDKGVLTEEMVSKVISGGKTDSKVKSPIKDSHTEKRRSMEDKENAHTIDDDDDVQIVDSPDEKRSDRRHRRRRRRHGSRSSKHDKSGSNRRRSRSERGGEERGSRSERVEERSSRNKHKSSEMSREDEEADKKKKKITRKEFEERMKRAKMNRKYRKRRDGSEEEVNEEEKENGENNKKENENEDNSKKENETDDKKEEGEEDGAVSEKEEGEWDSNEEEEGQCSSTGSSSYYSDYSDEGKNQGTHRRKSQSRSRSKSYSPHRSPSHDQRSSRRAPRVPIKTVPSGTVRMPQDEKEKKSEKLNPESKISSTQTKKKEEEEENWGQKCDIEFVDSEEDFDGENNSSKVPKKLGISFSVKKKVVPSINQKDIDDLPMKKRNPFDDLPDDNLPIKKRNLLDDVPDKNDDKNNDDQIPILSECEVEEKDSSDMEAKTILKCKDVSKETEENNTESIIANSVIIIPDDSNPIIESKNENKENKTTEKTLESISVSEGKENKDIIDSKETLENNPVSEAKDKNVNIASKETILEISVSEGKENNDIDNKTDEILIEEINHKKPIGKELLSSSKSDKDETTHCATNITEETNVQKVTGTITEECNKGSTIKFDLNKKVDTENTEPIIILDDKDEDIEDSREIISEDVVKKGDDIKVKLTVGKNKNKKVAEDKVSNDNPPPRTTRRSTRASKKEELEQKSDETEEISNIKKAKKKQKERKLAIENEKRILDFENEFEEPINPENSEDNKSKNIETVEAIHVSQSGDNRDSKEIIREQNAHEIPGEENLQLKTSDIVQNTKNVELNKAKDCEESFKGFEGRNVYQEPQVPNSESLKKSLNDGQVATKSSVEELYHSEGYSKIQLGVSALDLTISKNKGDVPSNQVTPNITGELSGFYQPDNASASNSVQDYSLNTPRTQDMDDEEEIDVVGGVDDEEIDVVGVDDDKVANIEDDNTKVAGFEDDNATTTGMEQFAAAQDYATGLGLHSEIEKLKDQNVGHDISKMDDKTVTVKSRISQESPGDFYRGMEELGYSDEEKAQDEVDIEKLRNSHVEPIRIETGLIRKKVPAKQKKDEVQYPDKSWSKDKRKKEKTKDTLVHESLGSLCSVLPRESVPKSELLEENSQTSEIARKDYNTDDECSRDSSKSLSETSKIMPEDESESRSSTQSKGANKEMEIIGEIEATTAGNDEIDDGRSSWSMRWLQSEKVQKVVSSSKMLSRVRKKIQQKDKATKVTAAKQNETEQENPKPKEPASNAVIGSIEEYERLFGKKKNTEGQTGGNSQPTTTTVTPTISTELTEAPPASFPETNTSQISATQQPSTNKVPIIDSDSEGDSEEEALWSKIMGK